MSAGQSINPAFLSQMFPNGIPQATIPQINPSSVPQVDPSSETSATLAQLMPLFKQQQTGLQDSLANAGIVGGSTPGAMQDLSTAQTQQATSALAPYNYGAATTNANNTLQTLFQNMQAGLQGGEYNTSNVLGAGQYDTGTFNNFLSQILGNQNQDWLAQLNAQTGLSEAAAGGQTGAYQPVYTQPTAPNFAGLGSSFAPAPQAPQPYPQTPPQNSVNPGQDAGLNVGW